MQFKPNKVISYLSALTGGLEPQYTFALEDIVYSKKHGHEICVMHLVGKNIFPKYTAEELLSDPNALLGVSPWDAISIHKLDQKIKERNNKLLILEVDRNGTILLRDSFGIERRYSEKSISNSREMIKKLQSEDAHDLGYRVGFKDGVATNKLTLKKTSLISKLSRINPFARKI